MEVKVRTKKKAGGEIILRGVKIDGAEQRFLRHNLTGVGTVRVSAEQEDKEVVVFIFLPMGSEERRIVLRVKDVSLCKEGMFLIDIFWRERDGNEIKIGQNGSTKSISLEAGEYILQEGDIVRSK